MNTGALKMERLIPWAIVALIVLGTAITMKQGAPRPDPPLPTGRW